MAAQGHDLTDDWSLPSANFVAAYAYFAARLGAFFMKPDVLITMYRSTIQLHDLSDQSALEIRVRI